jgi:hypothetical protein
MPEVPITPLDGQVAHAAEGAEPWSTASDGPGSAP